MSCYKIIQSQHGQGYRIEVVGADGARHTMLGFDTENEAIQWVERDKRLELRQQLAPMLDAAD